MSDVRDSITRIIRDRAHNQGVIARRAGMSPDKLCSVLRHRRRLDANEFLALCIALGMSPEAVAAYGGEEAHT